MKFQYASDLSLLHCKQVKCFWCDVWPCNERSKFQIRSVEYINVYSTSHTSVTLCKGSKEDYLLSIVGIHKLQKYIMNTLMILIIQQSSRGWRRRLLTRVSDGRPLPAFLSLSRCHSALLQTVILTQTASTQSIIYIRR